MNGREFLLAVITPIAVIGCGADQSKSPPDKKLVDPPLEEVVSLYDSYSELLPALQEADTIEVETSYGGDAFVIMAGTPLSRGIVIEETKSWTQVPWDELRLNVNMRGVLRVFSYAKSRTERKVHVGKSYFLSKEAPKVFEALSKRIQQENSEYTKGEGENILGRLLREAR